MLITNLYSNKVFQCSAFSRLDEGDGPAQFKIQLQGEDREKFINDLKYPGKYYKLLHFFEADIDGEVKLVREQYFFKVIETWTIKPVPQGYFQTPGDDVFRCQELDNFGQTQMVKDLTKLDSTRKWYKLLDGTTEKA